MHKVQLEFGARRGGGTTKFLGVHFDYILGLGAKGFRISLWGPFWLHSGSRLHGDTLRLRLSLTDAVRDRDKDMAVPSQEGSTKCEIVLTRAKGLLNVIPAQLRRCVSTVI